MISNPLLALVQARFGFGSKPTRKPQATPFQIGQLWERYMALDIGIGDGSSPCPVQNEPSLSLDDDGYYWFLYPLFEELRTATGQHIDLYGDASFFSKDLVVLEEMLFRAKHLVERQPTSWEVCTGYVLVPWQKESRTRPHQKKLFATVEKQSFLLMLCKWEDLVVRAKELKRPIVCFGD